MTVDEGPVCEHGKRLWGNYGDGRWRHYDDDERPCMAICPAGADDTASALTSGDRPAGSV